MRRQTVAATAGGRRAVLVDGLTVSVAPVARQRDAAAELIVINTLSYPEPIVWSPPAWRTSVPGPSAAEHDTVLLQEILERMELENGHFAERLQSDEVKQAITSFFAARAKAPAT